MSVLRHLSRAWMRVHVTWLRLIRVGLMCVEGLEGEMCAWSGLEAAKHAHGAHRLQVAELRRWSWVESGCICSPIGFVAGADL